MQLIIFFTNSKIFSVIKLALKVKILQVQIIEIATLVIIMINELNDSTKS